MLLSLDEVTPHTRGVTESECALYQSPICVHIIPLFSPLLCIAFPDSPLVCVRVRARVCAYHFPWLCLVHVCGLTTSRSLHSDQYRWLTITPSHHHTITKCAKYTLALCSEHTYAVPQHCTYRRRSSSASLSCRFSSACSSVLIITCIIH